MTTTKKETPTEKEIRLLKHQVKKLEKRLKELENRFNIADVEEITQLNDKLNKPLQP
jgi:predicted nuclease with TOPRIM domain